MFLTNLTRSKQNFVKKSHFLKSCTISYPNIALSNFKRGSYQHIRNKNSGPKCTSHHIFFLAIKRKPFVCILFCNEWMHLIEISLQVYSHKEKLNQKNRQKNVFLLKYHGNCLKSQLKYAKYGSQVEIYKIKMSLKIT